jgi:hypothetical protein
MAEPDDPKGPVPPDAEAPGPAKRSWQPPKIHTGQLFESDSLACMKAGPEPLECASSPPESLKC